MQTVVALWPHPCGAMTSPGWATPRATVWFDWASSLVSPSS